MRNQAHIDSILERNAWKAQWQLVRTDVAYVIAGLRHERWLRQHQGPPTEQQQKFEKLYEKWDAIEDERDGGRTDEGINRPWQPLPNMTL